jgi:hypothetical protein
MTRDIPSIARAFILMLAFAWPFGAILYIPFLDVTLLPLAGAVVVILALIDAIGNRDRRPPFELVWPVMAATLLVWFDTEIDSKTPYTISLALFLAVVQFSQGGRFIATCLRTTAAGGAVVAALAAVNVVVESVNAFGAGVLHMAPPGILFAPMLTSPEAFWVCLFTVVICLLAAFEGWLREPRARTAISAFAIAASAFPVIVLAPGIVTMGWWMEAPETFVPGLVHVALMLILLWLAARVVARVSIDRGEHRTGTRAASFLAAAAFVGVILLIPHLAFPGAIIVPAILAGGATVSRDPHARTLPAAICIVPAIALLGLNLLRVYPANQDDPRNYEAFLRRDVEVNRLDRAWKRVSAVRASHYLEPRACLWSARLALAYDRPYQAAHEFANTVGKPSHQGSLLPAPTQSEIDDFLVRIRDYCSNLPSPADQFAYEKALVAAGKDASVLPLLKNKASNRTESIPPIDRSLLIDTMSTALDCSPDLLDQSDLTDDALWALLVAWGAEVHAGVIPGLGQPATVVARFGVGEIRCDTTVGGRADRESIIYILNYEGACPDPSVDLPSSNWAFLTGVRGLPEVRLQFWPDVADSQAGYSEVDSCDAFIVTAPENPVPPYPDKPAILILLP